MRHVAVPLFVVVFGISPISAQMLERINPAGLSKPTTYSHIVKAGKTLYIAGQVGAKPDGTIAGDTMAAQLEQVLANLQTALKSQGADFSHVAKINIYVTDVEAFRAALRVLWGRVEGTVMRSPKATILETMDIQAY